MKSSAIIGGLAALALSGAAAQAAATEVRLSADDLDRVVAGEDPTVGESFSFVGSSNVLLRTSSVPTPLPFPVFGSIDFDAPTPVTPPSSGPVGFGQRDLFAAFRLVLGL